MAARIGRRGVLMTATARKPRAAWRENEGPDESDDEVSEDETQATNEAKESRLEWESISREVREEKRRQFAETEFAEGKRHVVANYEEVAVVPAPSPETQMNDRVFSAETIENRNECEVEKPDRAACQLENAIGETSGSKSVEIAVSSIKFPNALEPTKRRTRGGRKINRKKKRLENGDTDVDNASADGEKRRRKEDDEEAKKWIRVRLAGESKPKRIKAARVVYYFDHDSSHGPSGSLSRAEFQDDLPSAAQDDVPLPLPGNPKFSTAPILNDGGAGGPSGNFRNFDRLNLWSAEDDSDC